MREPVYLNDRPLKPKRCQLCGRVLVEIRWLRITRCPSLKCNEAASKVTA